MQIVGKPSRTAYNDPDETFFVRLRPIVPTGTT